MDYIYRVGKYPPKKKKHTFSCCLSSCIKYHTDKMDGNGDEKITFGDKYDTLVGDMQMNNVQQLRDENAKDNKKKKKKEKKKEKKKRQRERRRKSGEAAAAEDEESTALTVNSEGKKKKKTKKEEEEEEIKVRKSLNHVCCSIHLFYPLLMNMSLYFVTINRVSW